ncbi:MAG: hypothetical protein ABGW49_01565 [Nitrosopumilus sp.]|jgi:hypothetical protein|nr:hypothetical protein [Nitrosopumilus sp.]
MTPIERKRLQKLDDLILDSSMEELHKIQEIDYHTQMDGLSLYDVYVDSSSLINNPIKKSFSES